MEDEEEVVVALKEESPPEETVVVVEPEEKKVEAATETDPIEDLKSQWTELLEKEKKDRESAERQAASERQARVAAERQVESARTEVADTRLATLEQGIEAAKVEAAAAKAEWKAAQEAGDWNRAADANDRAIDARAKLLRYDEAKADLEHQKTAPRQETTVSTSSDPVEAFLARCTPATAAWLRSHPDDARVMATGSDARRSSKLTAAHSDALAEGCAVDTPDYFKHVEKFLGMTKEAPKEEPKVESKPKAKSPPVAPVSASRGISNSHEVRLTKGEAASATDGTLTWNYDSPEKKFKKGDPIGIEEFARRKREMKKQGLYDRNYIAE